MSAFPGLLSDEVAADPHALYRRLRAEAPIYFDPTVNAYLVSRYDDVKAIYKNSAFSNRPYEFTLEPVHGRTILQMDGSEHAKKRAVASPLFRGDGLDSWMSMLMRNAVKTVDQIVERVATRMVDDLSGRAEIDLVEDFANYFPVYVIADMLGFDSTKHAMFVRWYTMAIRSISNLSHDPEIIRESNQLREEIAAFVGPIITQRRKNPGHDLLSLLASSSVDGEELPDAEIKPYVSLLLTAGAETTDKTFASLFRNILAKPEQVDVLKAEPEMVTKAIAETLRYSPPSQINIRMAEDDIDLNGQRIEKGATLMLLIGSANRDASRYENPDEFVLDRADLNPKTAFTAAADHLAFGNGRHFCLGALLAKAELETGVRVFLDRFPNVRLAPGQLPQDVGVKMRGPKAVRVTV